MTTQLTTTRRERGEAIAKAEESQSVQSVSVVVRGDSFKFSPRPKERFAEATSHGWNLDRGTA